MSDTTTSTFSFPAKIEVRGADGKSVPVDTQTWSDEFVQYMLVYAWSVRMQRCTASAKDKAKALKEMFASQCRGELGDATGARGPSLDPVTKAWIAYFNEMKFKVSEKAISQNNLELAQNMLCASAIIKMEPEAKERITEEVAARFEAWKAYVETNDPALSVMIQAEKAKAAIKSEPKAFVPAKGAF